MVEKLVSQQEPAINPRECDTFGEDSSDFASAALEQPGIRIHSTPTDLYEREHGTQYSGKIFPIFPAESSLILLPGRAEGFPEDTGIYNRANRE